MKIKEFRKEKKRLENKDIFYKEIKNTFEYMKRIEEHILNKNHLRLNKTSFDLALYSRTYIHHDTNWDRAGEWLGMGTRNRVDNISLNNDEIKELIGILKKALDRSIKEWENI